VASSRYRYVKTYWEKGGKKELPVLVAGQGPLRVFLFHFPCCCHSCNPPIVVPPVVVPYHLVPNMTELQKVACVDPYLIFDGKRLHKRAFPRKGKPTFKMAAMIAMKLEEEMDNETATYIMERMTKVKKAFRSKIEHYVTSLWIAQARSIGMKLTTTGAPVESWDDIVRELETNPRMESFQNWYNICYKDREIKAHGKQDTETNLLKELKIQYHDQSLGGGCVGELLAEVQSKLIEQIQTRSRNTQCLHLVKSRPSGKDDLFKKTTMNEKRRGVGMYYIIRSDSKGKIIDYTDFNVR
jgi:hypothetical protein